MSCRTNAKLLAPRVDTTIVAFATPATVPPPTASGNELASREQPRRKTSQAFAARVRPVAAVIRVDPCPHPALRLGQATTRQARAAVREQLWSVHHRLEERRTLGDRTHPLRPQFWSTGPRMIALSQQHPILCAILCAQPAGADDQTVKPRPLLERLQVVDEGAVTSHDQQRRRLCSLCEGLQVVVG